MDNKVSFRWETPKDKVWVPRKNAVPNDKDNDNPTFVGRALMEGDKLPGKIIPSDNACYVTRAGKTHKMAIYDVLTTVNNSEIVWVPSSKGRVPTGAVEGGRAFGDEGYPLGQPLYIGRVKVEGVYLLGKVHPSHKGIYFSFNNEEKEIEDDYEVLCVKSIKFE